MRRGMRRWWQDLSLAQQFMLASFFILVASMLGIGWWVGEQIQAGVVNQTAATVALYVDSFVSPHLQDLGQSPSLAPVHVRLLDRLLAGTPFGQQIVAFKVWNARGRILYSTNPALIGQVFPVQEGLARAWQGEVVSKISSLQKEENTLERKKWSRLLETYSPVFLKGSNRIIAVVECYQPLGALEQEITAAKQQSWLVVGATTLTMYLLLAGIVFRGSNTIDQQQKELQEKVAQLTTLLTQNQELHARVQRAATRTAALNERFLRRISAELHDGPAQALSLALLRLDNVVDRCTACPWPGSGVPGNTEELDVIQASLRHALQEMRTIAAGLRLPELERLTLEETLVRVVRTHERRTNTVVRLSPTNLPAQVPLPVKITLYRVVQEALSNA
ncbi:MAG: sensor histidine kinase, partial [Nitrospinota bacterium]